VSQTLQNVVLFTDQQQRNRASYRDLMGTAKSIVQMDDEIARVEANIASLGQRCNAGILEKSSLNVGLLESSVKAYGAVISPFIHDWEGGYSWHMG
jgi:hypothetical protein